MHGSYFCKPELKRGSAKLTFSNSYGPAMLLNDGIDDGQPQARSGAYRLCCKKRFEDALPLVSGDSWPVIVNLKTDHTPVGKTV